MERNIWENVRKNNSCYVSHLDPRIWNLKFLTLNRADFPVRVHHSFLSSFLKKKLNLVSIQIGFNLGFPSLGLVSREKERLEIERVLEALARRGVSESVHSRPVCPGGQAGRLTGSQAEEGANAKFLSGPSRRFRMHRMGARPRSLRACLFSRPELSIRGVFSSGRSSSLRPSVRSGRRSLFPSTQLRSLPFLATPLRHERANFARAMEARICVPTCSITAARR